VHYGGLLIGSRYTSVDTRPASSFCLHVSTSSLPISALFNECVRLSMHAILSHIVRIGFYVCITAVEDSSISLLSLLCYVMMISRWTVSELTGPWTVSNVLCTPGEHLHCI
jgi:hypothetical protein